MSVVFVQTKTLCYCIYRETLAHTPLAALLNLTISPHPLPPFPSGHISSIFLSGESGTQKKYAFFFLFNHSYRNVRVAILELGCLEQPFSVVFSYCLIAVLCARLPSKLVLLFIYPIGMGNLYHDEPTSSLKHILYFPTVLSHLSTSVTAM